MSTADHSAEILIVDDEAQIRSILRGILEGAGYAVREAEAGQTAIGAVVVRQPNAIILDLGLPDMTGSQVLAALRPFCLAPVMILSVFGQEESKVGALDAGADDYLTKPFGSSELLARLRALLRRTGPTVVPVRFRFGPIEVDIAQRRVFRGGQRINLTATEFELLRLLIVHHDQVLTHRKILREVWSPKVEDKIHYLRTFMMRLRQKLGDDVAAAGYIQTESRVGYRFVTEPTPMDAGR